MLKFWDGLSSDLWEIMILLNAKPEVDDINKIVAKAEQAEKSRDEKNRERSR